MTPACSFPARICSYPQLRSALRGSDTTDCLLLCVDSRLDVTISPESIRRMRHIISMTGASMVYSDYLEPDMTRHRCNAWQQGSVRDDFDFGPLVMVNTARLREALDRADTNTRFAAWYEARLALSAAGPLIHIPETLYLAGSNCAESQFDYVDPRNEEVQREMEAAFTRFLRATGAWLPAPSAMPPLTAEFPVEASVIIPVRNRCHTIADAIDSALSQSTDFDFNVIVVDNHSTDGTSDIIASRARLDSRVIHITPQTTTLGIGGCWNLAVSNPMCGRYAVQLDSDDIYSTPLTLATIVERFRRKPCAMVIGSYILTDRQFNEIPPGLIDHREWTAANGLNNALRINGFGAPRAFATEILRSNPMPDVCYGEDYAVCLAISRTYPVERIFAPLYLCRRWEGNSDAALSPEKKREYDNYKDSLRSWEISARRRLNNSPSK